MENAEEKRVAEAHNGQSHWLRWGPYLSERQWGTVREDYSKNGTPWDYFPHDHARSRTYRWGEDGIAGISDSRQRLCFALTLWNGKDPILKERLFGLTGSEGNHGEDVKELYYYLDNTPSHSYMKHLYKYPHVEFPYARLLEENRKRSKQEMEFEVLDTWRNSEYFDVFTEYAKAGAEDILVRITAHNRGRNPAPLWLLPTLWFRNNWSFGELKTKPSMQLERDAKGNAYIVAEHPEIGTHYFYFETPTRVLFTENETNTARLFGKPNATPFVKDAFHTAVINDDFGWLEGYNKGTKTAPVFVFDQVLHKEKVEIHLRITREKMEGDVLGEAFEKVFADRKKEADEFYAGFKKKDADWRNIQRQALAGMLWSKQFYYIDMPRWLEGDPGQPPPPESRKTGRNHQWWSLNNEDIISMPDKWEYPWFASWDLAFHCVPLAMVDPQFAKNQLILFLREWYMHPNGQIPAYEWAFGNVNPPVHAWASLQVYKMDKAQHGHDDKEFLKRVFQKLLLNFTWWVNRKDHNGKNVFEGGFLGLDNIGVFDRSSFLPGGGYLEQADGTAWMAMYCLNMLEIALILAEDDVAYEDMATKFFEHFVYIAASLNRIGADWTGAWDEAEGFFYDILALPDGKYIPLKVRSLVGLSTMFAVLVLDKEKLKKLPDFYTRLKWFYKYRKQNQVNPIIHAPEEGKDILLSLVPPERLERLLHALLDEQEFLSKGGIRSVSKRHETPYSVEVDGQQFGLQYEPGETTTNLFGGNSNWRGPVWMPMNYLLINSLKMYVQYYGDTFQVEYPTGSGTKMPLGQIADELSRRLICLFARGENDQRPVHDQYYAYATDPDFRDLVLFYEYFHGETGRGLGASHQTGWTGLVADLMESI